MGKCSVISKILFFGLSSIIMISCDSGEGTSGVHSIRYGTPILLEREDTSCSTNSIPFDSRDNQIDRGYISYLSMNESLELNQSPSQYLYTNTGLFGWPSIHNKNKRGIIETYFNSLYKEDESSDGNTIPENYTPGEKLTMCHSDKVYSKNSIEYMGLSTSYVLTQVQKAYAYLKRSANNKEDYLVLPGITLQIQPQIVKESLNEKGEKITEYHTDNAYYSNDTVYILPHSPTYYTYFPESPPLWNTPFVISHEYGHHVFFYHFTEKQNTIKSNSTASFINKLIDSNHDCFSSASIDFHFHTSNKKEQTMSEEEAVSLTKLTLKSFTEGFSDLFSYYTLSIIPQLQDKKNWPLFKQTKNRDLNSDVFGNGQKKILDLNTWSMVITQISPSKTDILNGVPNFSDEHILGAIFTRFVHKILETVDLNKPSANNLPSLYFSNEDRLNVLMKWVKNAYIQLFNDIEQFDPNISINQVPIEMFKSLLKSFLKAVETYQNRSLTPLQCALLKETYSYSGFDPLHQQMCP